MSNTANPKTMPTAVETVSGKFLAAIAAFAIGVLVMTAAPATAQQITPAEARAIAKEATIYGFPLVDNYRIQYSYFVDRGGDQFKSPWNTLVNNARVFTPADTAVQTPNSDTPYSFVGADLRAEPLVFTVPAIDRDRYYSLQFIDMYTFNFAYVGSRATGNDAGNFLLAGPGWNGETPPGVKAVIRSETELALVGYRTQLFSPDDIDNVKKIQAGYKVQPLSQFLGKPAPPAAPAIDFIKPLSPEAERTSPEFFNILNFVLGFCPPNPAETEIMARFAKLGIGPHGTFDAKALSPEMLKAVEDGMADAWAEFKTYKEFGTRHRQAHQRRRVRHARISPRRLSRPLLGRGPWHLRQLEGRGDISPLFRRQREEGSERGEPLRAPFRAGRPSSGQRLLVADPLRIAFEPALGQSAQSLPDQFGNAAGPQAR